MSDPTDFTLADQVKYWRENYLDLGDRVEQYQARALKAEAERDALRAMVNELATILEGTAQAHAEHCNPCANNLTDLSAVARARALLGAYKGEQ